MMDNKTCRVDILSVSLGDEGYLIIPRETRELCAVMLSATVLTEMLSLRIISLSLNAAQKQNASLLPSTLLILTSPQEMENFRDLILTC